MGQAWSPPGVRSNARWRATGKLFPLRHGTGRRRQGPAVGDRWLVPCRRVGTRAGRYRTRTPTDCDHAETTFFAVVRDSIRIFWPEVRPCTSVVETLVPGSEVQVT